MSGQAHREQVRDRLVDLLCSDDLSDKDCKVFGFDTDEDQKVPAPWFGKVSCFLIISDNCWSFMIVFAMLSFLIISGMVWSFRFRLAWQRIPSTTPRWPTSMMTVRPCTGPSWPMAITEGSPQVRVFVFFSFQLRYDHNCSVCCRWLRARLRFQVSRQRTLRWALPKSFL